MVRKDREVTDFGEVVEIVDGCDVCRLALNGDDGVPYIVALNFGYVAAGGRLTLYFHSALRGRKHDLIARDNRAAFEMDRGHELLSVRSTGYCTMNYESVTGRGRIAYVDDPAEKERALTLLTDRYHPDGHFAFAQGAVPRTAVYRLEVESLTAKRKATPPRHSS